MFKQLFTALKARRARRGQTKKSTPVMEEIQQSLRETGATLDRIAKQQADWDAEQAKWDAEQAKWDAKLAEEQDEDEEFLENLYEMAGLVRKPRSAADRFFASALESAMPFIIQGIAFDDISVDECYFRREHEMNCDIVLFNSQYIAIVEAEDFLELDHVVGFDKNLREILPRVLPRRHKHRRLVPVLACMDLSEEAKQKARELGMVLLHPHGQQSRVEDDHLRVRPSVLNDIWRY